MGEKRTAAAPEPSAQRQAKRINPPSFNGRDGLGVYLARPETFDPSRVIYHTPDFVAIHDMYPKASVHALLLPRNPEHNRRHPLDAFDDPVFRALVQAEALKLKRLVAKELQRRFGPDSMQDRARQEVLATALAEPVDPDPDHPAPSPNLPAGRDWEASVKVGIHSHPSMNHLHIHVISVDQHSPAHLNRRSHYNRFTTPFLVDVADFPLAADDPRRFPDREGYLEWPLTCWRCHAPFHDRFKRLKAHLADEYEEWRRE